MENLFEILNSRAAIEIFLSLTLFNTIVLLQDHRKMSYPFIYNLMKKLKKYKLIRIVKKGRSHKIYYTSKGEEIAILLDNLNRIYNK